MPIYMTKRVSRNALVGLWKIVESEQYFLSHLELHPEEKDLLRTIKGAGHRTQWLASRWLMHLMSERSFRTSCIKDEYGKPYLKDSDHYISLSHSVDLVAVAAGLMPVGVDIQKIVPKITRIKTKFCNDSDLETDENIEELRLAPCYLGS